MSFLAQHQGGGNESLEKSAGNSFLGGFRFNLMSVHRLCHDLQCEVIFTYEACVI